MVTSEMKRSQNMVFYRFVSNAISPSKFESSEELFTVLRSQSPNDGLGVGDGSWVNTKEWMGDAS